MPTRRRSLRDAKVEACDMNTSKQVVPLSCLGPRGSCRNFGLTALNPGGRRRACTTTLRLRNTGAFGPSAVAITGVGPRAEKCLALVRSFEWRIPRRRQTRNAAADRPGCKAVDDRNGTPAYQACRVTLSWTIRRADRLQETRREMFQAE